MSVPTKVNVRAVLHNLPAKTQTAIMDYLEGNPQKGLKSHTYKETLAWLKESGIKTWARSLYTFRGWFHMQEQLLANAAVTESLIEVWRKEGWIKTAKMEAALTQIFFNRLALQQQDLTSWRLMQQMNLGKEKVALDERKVQLDLQKYKDQTDKTKAAVSSPELTPEEKEARIKEIFGI